MTIKLQQLKSPEFFELHINSSCLRLLSQKCPVFTVIIIFSCQQISGNTMI